MLKVQDADVESESSQSESEHAANNHFGYYLDQQKIQSFYETCERLQKFVIQTKKLFLQDNQKLQKYLSKFQKPQNQRRNDQLHSSNIVNLARERVQRMVRSQKPKKNWTLDDRTILNWVVLRVALFKQYKNVEKQFTKEDWEQVADLIPGANKNSCMFKWLSLHKTNLNEASWSEEESELLKTLVSKYVNANKSIRWKDVCKKLYLQSQHAVKNYRTHKQCKEHWNCKLNPNIKRQPWTQEEDILLLQTIKQNSGLKKWVEMVKLLKGRTQNAVKNRFNLIIQKERKCIGKYRDELDLINAYLQRCQVQNFTNIIKPDSQELDKEMDKVKKKKTPRPKKIKKDDKELSPGFKQFISGTNEKIGILGINTEKLKFENMEKVSIQNFSAQQTMENGRVVEEFISIENMDHMGSYNHRANDNQYDFMRLQSSMND